MSEAPLHMHRTCKAKQLMHMKGPPWAQEREAGFLYMYRETVPLYSSVRVVHLV